MKITIISLALGTLAMVGVVASNTSEPKPEVPRREVNNAPVLKKTNTHIRLTGRTVVDLRDSLALGAVPTAMEALLQAKTPSQRIQAIQELRRIHDHLLEEDLRTEIEERVRPVFRAMTTAKSRETRMIAIEASPSLDFVGASSLLADILKTEKDEELTLLAGQKLGKIATPEVLARLVPLFDRRDRRDIQIAVGMAWLDTVERTDKRFDREQVISRILPALDDLMDSPTTTMAHHRIAHRLETKLKKAYGLVEAPPARPIFEIVR